MFFGLCCQNINRKILFIGHFSWMFSIVLERSENIRMQHSHKVWKNIKWNVRIKINSLKFWTLTEHKRFHNYLTNSVTLGLFVVQQRKLMLIIVNNAIHYNFNVPLHSKLPDVPATESLRESPACL